MTVLRPSGHDHAHELELLEELADGRIHAWTSFAGVCAAFHLMRLIALGMVELVDGRRVVQITALGREYINHERRRAS